MANDNDPWQVAQKAAYARGEIGPKFPDKQVAVRAIQDMLYADYEDEKDFYRELKGAIDRGEYTVTDLAVAFRKGMKQIFKWIEDDDGTDEQD